MKPEEGLRSIARDVLALQKLYRSDLGWSDAERALIACAAKDTATLIAGLADED